MALLDRRAGLLVTAAPGTGSTALIEALVSQRGATEVVGRELTDALPVWADIRERVPVGRVPDVSATRPETLPIEIDGRERWLSISGVAFDVLQAVTHVGLYKYGARYADAGGGGPRIISKDIPLKAAFAKPTASNGKARPGAKVFSGRLTTTQPGKPASK